MVKIDFEFETKYGIFRDALLLPDEHNMTEEELQAMKQKRLDNWLAIIEAPAPDTSPEAPTEITV